MEERIGAVTLLSLGDMSAIGSRTFVDGSTSQYFTLAGEEYIRRFYFGNSYKNLRVVILCAVQGSGTFSLPVGSFGICVSSPSIAVTQGVKSSATTGWLGTTYAVSGSANTFTFTAGSPSYYVPGSNFAASTKFGANYSGLATGITGNFAVAGTGYRGYIAFGMNWGTPQFNGYCSNLASIQANFGAVDVIGAVESMPLGGNPQFRGAASGSSVTSASPGGYAGYPFDSLSLYWGSTTNPLEVYHIAAYATWN